MLDVLDLRWLAFSVAVSWVVRLWRKARQKRGGARSVWQIVVVICETNWIFVGFYVISPVEGRLAGLDHEPQLLFDPAGRARASFITVAIAFAVPTAPVEVTSSKPR